MPCNPGGLPKVLLAKTVRYPPSGCARTAGQLCSPRVEVLTGNSCAARLRGARRRLPPRTETRCRCRVMILDYGSKSGEAAPESLRNGLAAIWGFGGV
jgi:hypothetical protein